MVDPRGPLLLRIVHNVIEDGTDGWPADVVEQLDVLESVLLEWLDQRPKTALEVLAEQVTEQLNSTDGPVAISMRTTPQRFHDVALRGVMATPAEAANSAARPGVISAWNRDEEE